MGILPKKTKATWFYVAITAYILIFLATRLINVTDFPLNVDERRHIIRAEVTLNEADIFIGLRESWKQLYIWLVAIGLPLFRDHIFAARFMSILMGLGAAGVCYMLGNALYPRFRVGYLAALFYLVSPMGLFYDRLAYTESLLAMLIGLSILLSYQLWREPTVKWAISLGLVFGLATLAKAHVVNYYLAPLLFWLILGRNISWRKVFELLGVVYVTTIIAWLPLLVIGLPIFLEDHSKKFSAVSGVPNWYETVTNNLNNTIDWLGSYLTLPFVGLFFLAFGLIVIKRDKIGIILLILQIVPIVALTMLLNIGPNRYLLPNIIPLSIIIAWGLDQLVRVTLSIVERVTSKHVLTTRIHQVLAIGLFLLLCLPSLWFNYLIITNLPRAPLPFSDRGVFVEGRFSGYGLKESAEIVGDMAQRFPEVIILRGANLMDTIFSLEVIGLGVYLQPLENISYRQINSLDEHTIQELNSLAQQAPTLTLGTFDAEGKTLPMFEQIFDRPQAWQVASFKKPGNLHEVKLYQWLLWPDFAIHWLQQGGDAEPRVAWHPTDELITATGGTLVNWPKATESSLEAMQQAFINEKIEYLFVTTDLVNSQPDLFASFITVDGSRLRLGQFPPDWRLAYAYPDINCEWCLFYVRPPEHSIQAIFAHTFHLEGYDISATELRAGDSLHLTLHWHSLEPPADTVVIFVNLISKQGQLVAQATRSPLQGKWPQNNWPNGLKLADRLSLELDPELAAGSYQILVGLYDVSSMKRLPVQAAEDLITDNAVRLTSLTLE